MSAYIGFMLMFGVIYLHIGILMWLFLVPKSKNWHDWYRVILWAIIWPIPIYYITKEE